MAAVPQRLRAAAQAASHRALYQQVAPYHTIPDLLYWLLPQAQATLLISGSLRFLPGAG
jgi:hypothetical protein